MINVILTAIIFLALGVAGVYIYKEKKNGSKCIGCPNAKECGKMACECKGKE